MVCMVFSNNELPPCDGFNNMTKMRLRIFIICIAIIFLKYPDPVSGANIIFPWRSTSVFVPSGQSFHILYNNINSLTIDSVILSGQFNRIALSIDSVETGRFVYDHYTGLSVNNRIWVNVPGLTPVELYDLFIHTGGEIHSSPGSVKVLDGFNSSHTLIHITDLHLSRQWVGTPEEGYAKELELFSGFVKVANIINPDFILITGDNIMEYTMFDADSTGWGGTVIYDPEKRPLTEEKYKNLFYGAEDFSGVYGLDAPAFLIPGNHDFHGIPADEHHMKAEQWNRHMGKRFHGFTFAGTRVILADDSLGDRFGEIPKSAPMSGLQGRVHEEFLKKNGAGKVRILAQHTHNNIDTGFLDRNNINILLNGHNHSPHQGLVGTTPTLNIRPGVVCRSGEINNWEERLGFFRIIYIDGDKYDYTPPLRFCEDPTVHHSALKLNLTLDFKEPNDGTSRSNIAVIKNNFPADMPGCKIRFIMKKGAFEVLGGTIIQIFHTDNFSILDVLADVRSNEQAEVEILPIK
jgi:predicted MPP superfamily phosphohydrolase